MNRVTYNTPNGYDLLIIIISFKSTYSRKYNNFYPHKFAECYDKYENDVRKNSIVSEYKVISRRHTGEYASGSRLLLYYPTIYTVRSNTFFIVFIRTEKKNSKQTNRAEESPTEGRLRCNRFTFQRLLYRVIQNACYSNFVM